MPDTQTPPANPQTPYSPEWLYDEIMRHVEPDLMLGSIAGLADKYAGDSDEASRARMKRYEAAFGIYDKLYEGVAQIFAEEAHAIKREAYAQVMEQEAQEQKNNIRSAEASFDTQSS